MDRQHDPSRIASVLRSLDADVVGLQEVDGAYHLRDGADQLEILRRETGMYSALGPTLESESRYYGNAILSRWPIGAVRHHDLAVEGCEPRGALDADIIADGFSIRMIVAHLGLRERERRIQAERLLARLAPPHATPVVVVGDFNFWWQRSTALARLRGGLGFSAPLRTFPSRLPVLPLDRIWVDPPDLVRATRVNDSRLARVASDHLPIMVSLSLPRERPATDPEAAADTLSQPVAAAGSVPGL